MAFPVLILTIQLFYSKNFLNIINLIYNFILIFIFSIITTAELGIYDEWKTKLSAKAIRYLENPGEIYNSASTWVFILLLFILIFQFSVGAFVYKKWVWHQIKNAAGKIYFSFLFIIITFPLLLIGLRGGLQQIPITQSNAYFSKHDILNLTAVNSGWNLIKSLSQNYNSIDKNPFTYFDSDEANKITEEILTTPKDTTVEVLKNKAPNIVLIILEGWSADLVESLGGEKGITPCFHELEKNGILFTHMYSSGTRSEQGMSNIFGGFPSHPLNVITRQPDKFIKLPSLTKTLGSKGYHSLFIFGGQLSYGNMKSYIYFNNFDKIMEEDDFSNSYSRGKLGIHDEFIFPEFLSEINTLHSPFFAAMFTLSSHSPYDMPNFKENIQWPELEKEYVNAAYYSDSCLGDFISKSKKQAWFKNTLFVIVPDHSHSSYRSYEYWNMNYARIPMLFYGNVIKEKYQGSACNKFGSQADIAATLLHQTGISSEKFRWSKNLLNPAINDYAYFSNETGFGWVCPDGDFSYDHFMNKYFEEKLPADKKDSIEKYGKAYLQELYQEFWNY